MLAQLILLVVAPLFGIVSLVYISLIPYIVGNRLSIKYLKKYMDESKELKNPGDRHLLMERIWSEYLLQWNTHFSQYMFLPYCLFYPINSNPPAIFLSQSGGHVESHIWKTLDYLHFNLGVGNP